MVDLLEQTVNSLDAWFDLIMGYRRAYDILQEQPRAQNHQCDVGLWVQNLWPLNGFGIEVTCQDSSSRFPGLKG